MSVVRCPACRGPLTVARQFIGGRRRRVWWCASCDERVGKPLPEPKPYRKAGGV